MTTTSALSDPSQVAEDSNLRSWYARDLIRQPPASGTDPPPRPGRIPRVIVQFWDSSAVPPDVKECIASWQPLTCNGFTQVLFDAGQARNFIEAELGGRFLDAFDRCEHPAMQCDFFRLCYLVRNGGFYVDADEVYQGGDCSSLFDDGRLQLQPMCFDTSKRCMIESGVFLKRRVCPTEWIFYVNNNPLIAPPSHPVIRLALERSTQLLLTRTDRRFDVQEMTGPGNLTASLIRHAIASDSSGEPRDFRFLHRWGTISVSPWGLSYRDDERNWRFWQFLRATNREVGDRR